MINEDYNNYYDWNTYQINYQLIKQRLQELRSRNYSTQLITTIEKTLEKDEFYRLNITQLLDIIKANIHRFKPIDLTSNRAKGYPQNHSLMTDRTLPNSDKGGNRYGSTRTHQPNGQQQRGFGQGGNPNLRYNGTGGGGKENLVQEFDTLSENRVRNFKIFIFNSFSLEIT